MKSLRLTLSLVLLCVVTSAAFASVRVTRDDNYWSVYATLNKPLVLKYYGMLDNGQELCRYAPSPETGNANEALILSRIDDKEGILVWENESYKEVYRVKFNGKKLVLFEKFDNNTGKFEKCKGELNIIYIDMFTGADENTDEIYVAFPQRSCYYIFTMEN